MIVNRPLDEGGHAPKRAGFIARHGSLCGDGLAEARYAAYGPEVI